MRIRDWSSDVCSSDLHLPERTGVGRQRRQTGGDPPRDRHVPAPCLGFEHPQFFRQDVREIDRLRVERQGAGLGLAQVEDVADESEEVFAGARDVVGVRSEEHTSELQSLMRISYAVFCLKKKNKTRTIRLKRY